MRIGKWCLYLSSVLLAFISISPSYAQPHTHGGRSHTHGLPAQGIGHRHNNGIAGKSTLKIRIKRVPTKSQARTARRPAPINEKAYKRYKRCVGWRSRVDDYKDEIDSTERKSKNPRSKNVVLCSP